MPDAFDMSKIPLCTTVKQPCLVGEAKGGKGRERKEGQANGGGEE